MAFEECLYLLNSKCTGYVHHDADTGEVTIKQPDAVSSLPRESRWGWLAKVVPTIRRKCVDGQDACEDEVHQELAAQVMNQATCGQLVIARPPLCGEVSKGNDLNPETQVRFDYLDPELHEDVGCPADVRFLMGRPGTLGDPAQTPCTLWSLMRRLTMLESQLGVVDAGTDLEASAYLPLFVPVAGGDEDDPCYQMRLSRQRVNSGLPTTAENCDTVEFRGKGTPTEGWKAVPKGMTYHPLEDGPELVLNTSSAGTLPVNLVEFPTTEQACGVINARFEVALSCGNGPSGALANYKGVMNNYIVGVTGNNNSTTAHQVNIPVTTSTPSIVLTATGAPVTKSFSLKLLGYEY